MKFLFVALALLATATNAFVPTRALPRGVSRVTRGGAVNMVEITKGVNFDTVAREWRMKWSPDDDKASLQEIQKVVDDVTGTLKGLDGVKDVQRIVCGGCLDYKLVTSLDADKFGQWEEAGFAPEDEFLTKVKAIPGVSLVETQTFTIMPL
eukprot:CAMPEP_0205922990 /NCGR_PEP_ID=MMETSP1325-20131115/15396_1 /ASSEMBLY_ACC=CAM_ASM_000708 /TAXON_ID=236786 /ORGANISM="Florenciella sp., Strain RCC1007" /LENGTH=150 /DNA_ID=CAMNT_0053291111 /DNA_START=26 /DNA_END=478 /DNA_ORIENTATION=+